jgi:hypothetical protein
MTTIEQPNTMQCNRCAAVFKATGQRCTATTLVGRRTCLRHGGASTGPRTEAGKRKCSAVRTVHGRETTAIRQERSLGSARVAVLEAVGFSINLMSGARTRGRRPDRMAEAYPELQALLKVYLKEMKTA